MGGATRAAAVLRRALPDLHALRAHDHGAQPARPAAALPRLLPADVPRVWRCSTDSVAWTAPWERQWRRWTMRPWSSGPAPTSRPAWSRWSRSPPGTRTSPATTSPTCSTSVRANPAIAALPGRLRAVLQPAERAVSRLRGGVEPGAPSAGIEPGGARPRARSPPRSTTRRRASSGSTSRRSTATSGPSNSWRSGSTSSRSRPTATSRRSGCATRLSRPPPAHSPTVRDDPGSGRPSAIGDAGVRHCRRCIPASVW